MVFGLCTGCCFSKKLVINSSISTKVSDPNFNRVTIYHEQNGNTKKVADKEPISSRNVLLPTPEPSVQDPEQVNDVSVNQSSQISEVSYQKPVLYEEKSLTYNKSTSEVLENLQKPEDVGSTSVKQTSQVPEYSYQTPVSSGEKSLTYIKTERAPPIPILSASEQESVNIQEISETQSIDVRSIGNKPPGSNKKVKAPPIPINNGVDNKITNINDEKAYKRDSSSSVDIYSPKHSLGELDSPKVSNDINGEAQERREGIAPIPVRIDDHMKEQLPVHIKDPKDEDLIRKAIQNNDFLNKVISGEQLKDVIAAMYNKDISAKETIIRQGDKGQHMYVSAKGTYQIIVKSKVVNEFKDVRVFGELAILYNAKRLASIKSVTPGKVWVLDSKVYQKIMIRHNIKRENEIQEFLMNNEILNVVGKDALLIVSNLLKTEFFTPGQIIVKQGDRGDKFYIIRAGTVTITKEGEGIVGIYKKGDCFGELALLEEDCRQATVQANSPGVECLTITRKEFIDHFGEIKRFKYIKVNDKPKDSILSVQEEFGEINLKELKIIKTLGVGGFGRVELVQHTKSENLVFALKYLKKIEIVQQNQQEHVYNEKQIQMNCRSPFIARLYRTYKDKKYIYFLMESCLGGDLWSLLQKQKNRRFEEKEARFICSCVLLAFEYLHARGVVYRDLKPENLLIAANGYIKLTDFGFAKKITTRGKTYTFAGTPEYVAPEIVLNRGHDRAVDYWAYGAFVFEMLSGRTPFRTDDSSHMKTYNKILSGIDNISFPTYINLKARHLVEKLCRPVPSERLGMQKNGIQDIKNHKWFLGLDWQKFSKLELPSPFKPKLNGPIDTKWIDSFKKDTNTPPDELSGWDEAF